MPIRHMGTRMRWLRTIPHASTTLAYLAAPVRKRKGGRHGLLLLFDCSICLFGFYYLVFWTQTERPRWLRQRQRRPSTSRLRNLMLLFPSPSAFMVAYLYWPPHARSKIGLGPPPSVSIPPEHHGLLPRVLPRPRCDAADAQPAL